jgi:hypothetical protein
MEASIQSVPKALRVGGADFFSGWNILSSQYSYPEIIRIKNMSGISYAIVVH